MPVLPLAELTAADVKALDRSRAVVVLCISPVEEHGPHLPLGTDVIESEAVGRRVCERLARERPDWTFLLYPALPIGADAFDHPGSVSVRPSTVKAVVTDLGLSLARQGFHRIIIANHHGAPRHNLALDAAARAIERRTPARVLSLAGRIMVDLYLQGGLAAFYDRQGIASADRLRLNQDVHAGAFETSELLALRPDLVRDGWQRLRPVLVPLDRLTRRSAERIAEGLGYFGAPALASAQLGEAYLDFLVERALPEALRFLDGKRVAGMALKWRALLAGLHALGQLRDLLGHAAPPPAPDGPSPRDLPREERKASPRPVADGIYRA